MFRIKFANSNESPVFLQVDPWAGVYILRKGDEIEIAAECEANTPSFDINEHNDTRILLLPDCSEYYVINNGVPVHWTEFPSNLTE